MACRSKRFIVSAADRLDSDITHSRAHGQEGRMNTVGQYILTKIILFINEAIMHADAYAQRRRD